MAGKVLVIAGLSERHPGVTFFVAGGYCEAASVCLSRHHLSPVDMRVATNGQESTAGLEWVAPDDAAKRAWANEIDATEAGAYGLALATVEVEKGLVAVARAETRTGADYYLSPKGDAFDDLEASQRLEVSGTDKGSAAEVLLRVRQKARQANKGSSNLPAVVSVVGFQERAVVTVDVTDDMD